MTAITPAPSRAEELNAKALAKLDQAKAIAAVAEDAGREFTDEERTTVKSLFDEARQLSAESKTAMGDGDLLKAMSGLGSELTAGAVDLKDSVDPADHGTPGLLKRARKSIGEQFTEDEAWK